MKSLDPNMVTFLLDHSMARSVVYGMMRNAATTKDDPKMVAWYAPVEKAVKGPERTEAWMKLIKHERDL